jgi:hypothetical protein
MRSPRRVAGLALLLASLVAPAAHATYVRTVAGDGTTGTVSSDLTWPGSLDVGFGAPQAVAMDHTPAADGLDYYVADTTGCRIFKVDGGIGASGATGATAVVLGLQQTCRNTDDFFFDHVQNSAGFPPPPDVPYLKNPARLASLADGRLLWSEANQGRVHAFDGTYIDTIVGSGTCGTPPATATAALSANLCKINGLAAHPTSGSTIHVSDGQTGRVYQMDGTNVTPVASGLTKPQGITYIGTAGVFLVVDHDAGKVWKFSTADNTVATVVASGLSQPADVAPAFDGGFYVTEEGTCRVVHVADLSGSGAKLVVAGSTCGGPSGDGGEATSATFPDPLGIASYASGLLIADPIANTIRRVERTTIVTAPGPFTNQQPFATGAETLDVGGTVGCTLQGAVASPQSFSDCAAANFGTNLPDDRYSLYAMTNHMDVGDPQGAEASWTLDTEIPNTPALTAPDDGVNDLPPRPTFSWTAVTDPIRVLFGTTSGIDRYEVLVDGTTVAKTVRTGGHDPATSAQADSGLSEGAHTWKVRAYDRAGNFADSSSRTLTSSSPPTAVLTIGPNRALAGTNVTFDGSGSSDPDGPLALYEWDFTGDGTVDASGPDAKATRSFTTPGDFTATLRVTDGVGRTATASAPYTITTPSVPPGQVGVTINNGAQYTNKPDVTVFLKVPPGTTQVLLSNDGGFLAPTAAAPAAQVPWRLDSSGPERLPKTVYVRFLNGAITLVTLTDDIILDERPPVVSQATLQKPPGAATAARTKVWKLNVKAADTNSGVAGVQVTANKRKPGALRAYKRKLTVKLASRPKFLRAKDKAGNYSGWRRVR